MNFETYQEQLRLEPKTWAVTGVAGFIGSNLLTSLLELDQKVVGLDNFSTGHRKNLDEALSSVTAKQRARFRFIEGDIREATLCMGFCRGADYVLHQAALGSVPRSIEDPVATHESNLNGFLHTLLAARDAEVRRFVYASSSSVYGDEPGLPKIEHRLGRPLSPYAVTKLANELYAEVIGRCYGLQTLGLRYFNVFGPRQDPNGPYAAVIPKWISALLRNEPVRIYGDGETSRDFCYVKNVVQANILAAVVADAAGGDGVVLNVAVNARTTLNELFQLLRGKVRVLRPDAGKADAVHVDFRAGDVRHSLADISKAEQLLGYRPTHSLEQGLEEALPWYIKNLG